MDLRADAAEVRRGIELLCVPDEVYELRALDTRRGPVVSGYYDDFATLARDAAECSDRLLATGVYITINPVKPVLLARAKNHLREYGKKDTTGNADIAWRRWLPVDLDPRRPSGISATDEEHAAALAKAPQVRAFLREFGWPDPVLIDSGNGAYALYRIDLPNDNSSRDLLQRDLVALSVRLDDEQVVVDKTMFNAGRIIRIPGTINRKGDNLQDRPHRRARML